MKNIVGIRHFKLVNDEITEDKSDSIFYFKAFEALNLGDTVLCETQYGIALGTVVELNSDYCAHNSVVSKIDLSDFTKGTVNEYRSCELECLMQDRVCELERIKEFEKYAAEDTTMSEYLTEYKTLNSNE